VGKSGRAGQATGGSVRRRRGDAIGLWITKARIRTHSEHLRLMSGNGERASMLRYTYAVCLSVAVLFNVIADCNDAFISRLGTLQKCNKVEADVRERLRLEAPDFHSDGIYKLVVQH